MINLRKCKVKGIDGYFHKWSDKSEIVGPSLMKGGHPGGELKYTLAIIEHEDGSIGEYWPKDIVFDCKIQKEWKS